MSALIGIAPTRGGVGATTVAIHLTHALARKGHGVSLAAGGRQAVDLALLEPRLSFLDDDVRLELNPEGSAPVPGAEYGVVDLPVGATPDYDLTALVIVAQPRPTSLAAVYEVAREWHGRCPLYVLVNGAPWPASGSVVSRNLVAACAANEAIGLTVLPCLDRSFLLSRCVVSGRTAFDLAPYMPMAKTVEKLATLLAEMPEEPQRIDLLGIRSERAA